MIRNKLEHPQQHRAGTTSTSSSWKQPQHHKLSLRSRKHILNRETTKAPPYPGESTMMASAKQARNKRPHPKSSSHRSKSLTHQQVLTTATSSQAKTSSRLLRPHNQSVLTTASQADEEEATTHRRGNKEERKERLELNTLTE